MNYKLRIIKWTISFPYSKTEKKKYITGAHGSGSAKQKAKYREQRANRHKGR